jgi:hypothetical protein
MSQMLEAEDELQILGLFGVHSSIIGSGLVCLLQYLMHHQLLKLGCTLKPEALKASRTTFSNPLNFLQLDSSISLSS